MKIQSWNCQGLGNPLTVNTLYERTWRERPNIVFVMETMMRSKNLEKIRNKCGYTNGLCVGSQGRSGGLGLWWKDINASLVTYDHNHIAVDVCGENEQALWRGVGIYGWPERANRHKTWNMIRALCHNINILIILFGDFNEILSNEEQEGGAWRNQRQIAAFPETLDDCALIDLGFNGNMFTWQRGREVGRVIRERLDRAVATATWTDIFPNVVVNHFPIYSSNHAMILIKDETP
ncbi:hypothetical protein RND81_04G058500 [Saponaria officinalis]|uniref:Endonuclease/exonuclease/phosphatase domain-containing protein n=1 Tax=Saponaria officinalis TaxID=3572 RepID=A0AAW1LHR1_SAPOF